MEKQKPTVLGPPEKMENESNQAYSQRFSAWLAGDDIRTKTDLRDWTGSLPFHLDKSP
jgi:hypothetical protein